MVGGNFSWVPYYCYLMGEEIRQNTVDKVNGFETIGDFMLAFMFNLMGNSLKIRQALTDIENNNKNQFYVDNAQQYGKIIRVIIDFDASQVAASQTSSTSYL
jgi:uncharacterized protein YfaP (DUF2135 family)